MSDEYDPDAFDFVIDAFDFVILESMGVVPEPKIPRTMERTHAVCTGFCPPMTFTVTTFPERA